jgi:hypothetical protein
MNFLKIHLLPLLFLCAIISPAVCAKTAEFIESIYIMQAPEDIVTIVEKNASLLGFETVYEIVVPKKAGIQINPWNKLAYGGINPQTQRPYILINPTWFLAIPHDEQTFLLARTFECFTQGMLPLSVKVVPYLWIALIFLLTLLFFWLLGKTALRKTLWLRALLSFCLVMLCNITILNTAQTKILQYLCKRHDMNIIKEVVRKTGNKNAAILALERLNEAINTELPTDVTFWTPFANWFQEYADKLKNN